jgi:glucosylceramidase
MLLLIYFSRAQSVQRQSPTFQGKISPTQDPILCMDVRGFDLINGAAVQISDCSGFSLRKNTWTWNFNGAIQIFNRNKCLDVPDNDVKNGKMLQLWDCNGTPAQQWNRLDFNDRHIAIELGVTGFCIDLNGNNVASGQQLQIWQCNGTPAQAWRLNGMQNA